MDKVKLIAVGDISLQTKNDTHPFEKVKEVFKNKDILFGNLETVLSNGGKVAEKAVVLYTPPDKLVWLKDAGFDILNIANNHIMDLGVEGVNETLKVLCKNDLTFIGVKNQTFTEPWAIVEKNGIAVGFLGYSSMGFTDSRKGISINRINQAEIIADIRNLKPQCDVVVISLHWGLDNVQYPSPEQIALAHSLIDAGATVILGHHPHVIQGIERYRSGLIAYSLGNFQFDPKVSRTKSNRSLILLVELGPSGLKNYSIIPVEIGNDFAPKVSMGIENESLDLVERKTLPITRGMVTERWWFEQIAWEYLSGNMKSFIVRIKRYGFMHFLQCIRWLLSPFCLRCYAAIIRRGIKRILGRT